MLPIMRQILTPRGLVKRGLTAWYDCQQGVDADILYDISGNGNHGQLGSAVGADVNDPTWSAEGLTFGGSHYVVLPFAAVFPKWTIIAVMKPTDITTDRAIVGFNRTQAHLSVRATNGGEVTAATYDGAQKVARMAGDVTKACMVTSRIDSGVGVTAGYNTNLSSTTAIVATTGVYTNRIGSAVTDTMFMIGDIYTVLLYQAPLSNREIKQTYQFLKNQLIARGVSI